MAAETSTPSTPHRTVADRVRARRRELGLTQLQVAARAGVCIQTVSMIERASLITPATAAKIGAVLGLFPEELLG